MKTISYTILLAAALMSSSEAAAFQGDDVCFPTVTSFAESNMKISGWYDNCNDEPIIVEVNGTETPDTRTCSAAYLQSFDGVPLDATGNTCYVNPIFDTPLDVFWLGPHIDVDTLKESQRIAVYYIGFSTRFNDTGNSSDTYMPTDCDANGVCTCTSIESIRTDWGKEELDNRHWCDELEIPGLTSCGSKILEDSVRVDESASNHCLLLGEKFTFAGDNVTKQMFCDVNLQVSFDPDGVCLKTNSPSSGYLMMASLLPTVTLVGMTLSMLL
mmetsp:Transcript_15144/g.25106  ORF Transcript_15144/g.25106 Transcript_15144/m.25106 type:complete len:271 (+) Transcript_15144:80-892(+)|eukprot:CAMPEP_0119013042 /NCGR_PEP_ID=MMETSP1176-20130426/7773_1 /TAXON_ID=265551 /ORGANISM="Synedropsis recta cf, Strain CCMP1620" /LENGTH=270 /DNA_ID=CAMNT_0006966091 /DNA_START=77 /DNA_END=889 /DNA_ORIENTATION=+